MKAPWLEYDSIPVSSDYLACQSLHFPRGKEQLPLQIDLVGTPYIVNKGMDWNPCSLNYGTRLEKLNLHYMHYLRDLDRENGLEIIVDWIESVPPFSNNYWRDSWNSYALSIRVVEWLDFLSAHSIGKYDSRFDLILSSISSQIRFLERNLELDIGGNHLMKNIKCLYRAALFFRGKKAERLFTIANELLDSQLDCQVLDDGMHFELSPSYHNQVLADLLDIRTYLSYAFNTHKFCNQKYFHCSKIDRVIDAMTRVTTYFTHPDGFPSLFSDGAMHMTRPPDQIICDSHNIIPFGSSLTPFQFGCWMLPVSGYCGFVGSQSYFVIDLADVGADNLPAHGHGDALSFEWSVRGQRVFVDPGVFEYHEGPMRNYSRSTSSHNTLTIDSCDQSEFLGSFRVGRRARVRCEVFESSCDSLQVVAYHDGYRFMDGSPIHNRQFIADNNSIFIADTVVGGCVQKVVSSLLLGPSVSVDNLKVMDCGVSKLFLVITPPFGCSVEPFRIVFETTARLSVKTAKYSPDFGVAIDVQKIILFNGSAPCQASFSAKIV